VYYTTTLKLFLSVYYLVSVLHYYFEALPFSQCCKDKDTASDTLGPSEYRKFMAIANKNDNYSHSHLLYHITTIQLTVIVIIITTITANTVIPLTIQLTVIAIIITTVTANTVTSVATIVITYLISLANLV